MGRDALCPRADSIVADEEAHGGVGGLKVATAHGAVSYFYF